MHTLHILYIPMTSTIPTKQRNSEDICEETHPWRSTSCTAWDWLDQYAQNLGAVIDYQSNFLLQTTLWDYFPSIQNGRIEWNESIEQKNGWASATYSHEKVIDGLFYVPPRRPNLHSPPVTPCKCMEQQPTQLPPTECAETSSSSKTHKQTANTVE